ncbi:hypothetical protein [Herbidospora mongoliensis]|uniref:hypothetical protein n=1 Tax=Herbidospora mongoliensis TaxID=688067 RepID=UPI0008303C57|nr:hypothetical protein [Herbidospora mongoliensis]
MPDVGDSDIIVIKVNPHDGSTSPVLMVTRPDRTTDAPAVSPGDDAGTWQAPVDYTMAGIWILQWTVTGTGRGTQGKSVAVSPLPTLDGRTYATTTQLADWLTEAPPLDAARRLVRATRYLDANPLKTAVYDVDDDGLPTAAKVITALMEATCAQVEWWIEHGDDGTGAGADYTSVTAGSISYSRAPGGAGAPKDPRQSPEAWEILDAAGLTGHAPRTGYC